MKSQVPHRINKTKVYKVYKTNRYGKYSITVSAVDSWNKNQKHSEQLFQLLNTRARFRFIALFVVI